MRIRSVGSVVRLSLLVLVIAGAGCKHPAPVTQAPPAPAAPPAQPTVTLQATPASIQSGQSATLRWKFNQCHGADSRSRYRRGGGRRHHYGGADRFDNVHHHRDRAGRVG